MTLPFFIWEDGGAVFLDRVSRTVLLERPATLILQRLLDSRPIPDLESLRDWLLEQGCEYSAEVDFGDFCADLIEVRNQILAELPPR